MFVEIRAVVPAIEEKIAKFQADYDANKAEANRYKGQVDKWMPLILEWTMLKKKRKPL